jgi:hypothetical protein
LAKKLPKPFKISKINFDLIKNQEKIAKTARARRSVFWLAGFGFDFLIMINASSMSWIQNDRYNLRSHCNGALNETMVIAGSDVTSRVWQPYA